MQLEEKGKEMTDKLQGAIGKLNEEASALEVEKEKKEVLNSIAVINGSSIFKVPYLCIATTSLQTQ